VANKMADKKKNASRSTTRSRKQNQMVEPKTRSNENASRSTTRSRKQDQVVEPKTRSDEKEPVKNVKAVERTRDERKAQESKAVRRDSKGPSSKGPAKWQVRLRSNRYVRFILDAYYELRHKVTWPTFNEARNMTIVVLLLSAAVGLILGVVDYGLQSLYVLLVHLGGK
jgi:preprotein translocase SecE subunit